MPRTYVQDSPLPDDARRQLDTLVARLRRVLGANFTGLYLHGSLAMGCFNPKSSDIDLLVRVREPPGSAERARVIDLLLDQSGNPFPLEISMLSDTDLIPWRHPTPFSLHYGEDWRGSFEADLSPGQHEISPVDPDLAAHITVLHARGIVLTGPEIEAVFPSVPEPDYLDSILRDRDWALERLDENPVYAVLNLARVLRFQTDGQISSKREAGEWMLDRLPDDLKPVAEQALDVYAGSRSTFSANSEIVRRYVAELIRLGEAHDR